MTATLSLAAGLLGAIVGSFLNVVIYRLPRGESIVTPGSRCPGCGHAIRPRDNIPVLSWLALGGRCRDCGQPISVRYPTVELVTALLFTLVAVVKGVAPELAIELPLVAILVAVSAIDLDLRIVPNRLVIPGAAWAVGCWAVLDPGVLPSALTAGAAAFSGMLVIALAHPTGLGMGDVKLAGMLGLYLGLDVLPALLCAFLAGSVLGVALIARHGAAARKHAIPFAPFLALGGVVGLLFGADLIAAYTARFL